MKQLWQKEQSIWPNFESLIIMWQNFELTLAKNAVKVNIQIVVNGEKIEQIIKPSGHTGFYLHFANSF